MTLPLDEAQAARHGGPAALAACMRASRRDTLATFATFERRAEGLQVPAWPTLSPPLWELGHIGWFQAWWIGRNPQRHAGPLADPEVARRPGTRPDEDALYDSSHVPHAARWQLPLPDAAQTRADLATQLAQSLALLHDTPFDDTGLYFHRLALLHEDMHHEAALYMAQSLGVAIEDARWQATPVAGPRQALAFEPGPHTLGFEGPGFAFDNELPPHPTALPETRIDSRVLCWDEYLPFVETGGYARQEWWSEPGRAWLATERPAAPRYVRQDGHGWLQWRHGRWQPLDGRLPACHLTAHEAEAWCRWAGRRLPTESEWERAAVQQPEAFAWGAVWEWTSSPFQPYPGFAPHPYRDYSAPWFGTRQVLRGASFLTQPRMRHVRYRNFFAAGRNDVPAGFRTCAA